MAYSHRLMIVFVMLMSVTGCSATTSVSTLTAHAPQFTQPASEVVDLESTSAIIARESITPLLTASTNSTQTATARSAFSAQSTQQSLLASFPRVCKENYSSSKISPNGLWLVEQCFNENDQDLIMTFSNSKRQVLWKLLYQEYLPKLDFVPDGGMSVVHWSNDGSYVYFTAFLGGDGGECFYGNQLETGTGLFRLNLQTGRTTTILPPNDKHYWYGFSVSPTDRRLVYGVHSRDLKVLDITTGKLVDLAHKNDFSQGGDYVWSPDGLQFIYSTVTSLDNWETRSYSIRLVDAISGNEEILLESSDHCFAARSWPENNIVLIEEDYGQVLIEFDVDSRRIVSEATSTPFP